MSKRIKSVIPLILPIIVSMGMSISSVQSFDLSYGSYIGQLSLTNSEGQDIVIPPKGITTILYFFNMDNIVHDNLLNNINFFSLNLNKGDKLKIYGISKGASDAFKQIRLKYNIAFDLINDTQGKAFSEFNYACSSCIRIILIDKESRIRYLSTGFDPSFLREIVQRYVE